ncbi:MAG TPA: Zn-ribbon domain-containing OB-fold protein [Anaerolineae bacterium]|nr:Zn-ribbon domain-containing OB-fold protein [Anaerolineae bacterium]
MSLLEKDQNAPEAWLGEMPITSRYTAGLAGEKFLRAIKDEGKILGSHCDRCGITYVPARQFCERCMDELDETVDVGKEGEVHTFTLLFENLDGTPREEPEIVAFISLGDGGLVHRLDEVELDDLDIGMPVEAVFKPKAEREGSILDIKYFRPVSS